MGGDLYVGHIDWGDGEIEYFDRPLALKKGLSISHVYQDSGIYEVTGYMFKAQVSRNQYGNYTNN